MDEPSAVDPMPTASDMRAPWMIRLQTSRPNESVPIQCCTLGAESACAESTVNGLKRQMPSASAAASTNITMMTRPMVPSIWRCARNVSLRQPCVEHVDREVCDHDDQGNQHHQVLDDRIIAPADRFHQKAGDAWDIENGFSDDQSADQKSRFDTDHGDDGKNGIFERMAIVDGPFGGALGTRRADVILPQYFKHRGACDPHHQRGAAEADRQCRDAVDRACLAKALWIGVEDRHGSEQGDRGHQDQQAEPERRQRQAAQADDAQDIIQPGALIDRADDAQRNPDRRGEQQRQAGQPRRDRYSRQDFVERGLFGYIGIAEIAAQQSADPVQILHDDRLIEPEFAFQIGLVGRVDISGGGKQDVDDIAGYDPQQHKDDDRDPEQGHEHQYEAPHDIGKQLAAPVGAYSAKVDTGFAIGIRASYQAGWRGLYWQGFTFAIDRRYLSSHTSS